MDKSLSQRNVNIFDDSGNGLTVADGGKVGIGTAPATTLDVNGITTFRDYLKIGAAGVHGVITWGGGLANTVNFIGASGKNLSLGTDGAYDKLVIKTDGKIGIGTTDPKYDLQVNGDIALGPQGASTTKTICSARSDGGSSNRAAIRFVTNSNNDESLSFDVLDSGVAGHPDALKIDYTGKIGIGTTAPATPLHVWSTSYPQFRVSYNSALYFTLDHAATLNVYGNDWYVRLNGSEKFRIKQDGNVGIGNTSPDFDLEVGNAGGTLNTEFRIVGEKAISAATSGISTYLWADGTTHGLNAWNYAGGAHPDLYIGWAGKNVLLNAMGAGGKVGIGSATPIRQLDVLGAVAGQYSAALINTSATGHGLYIKAAPNSASYMALAVDDKDGATILVARGDKRVGIGTNAPGGILSIGSSNESYFSSNAPNTLNFFYNTNSDTGGWINYRGYQDGTTQTRDLIIGDGKGNKVATFDGSTKRVGIGTDVPSTKLQVNDTSDSRLLIYETGASPYTATLELASQAVGTYGALIQYTSGAERLTIQNYGRTASNNSNMGGIAFKTKLNNTTPTEVMSIHGFSGNVGIGDITPSYKLDVNGTFRVTGAATFDSSIGFATVLAGNGTASLPSFAFTNDPNTGMYNDGANDNLKFSTGGVIRAFLSATQWSVTGNLVASGNVQGVNGVFSGNITTSTTLSTFADRIKIITGSDQLNIGQWDTANHRIEADANRPLMITSYQGNINLGISGNTRLNVHDAGIATTGNITATGKLTVGSSVTATSKAQIHSTQSNTMTDAEAFLALKGNGGDGMLMGQTASSPYGAWIQAGYLPNIGTSHHYPLLLQPHGSNVGIGTTAPDEKLEIYDGYLKITDAVPTMVFERQSDALKGYITSNVGYFQFSYNTKDGDGYIKMDVNTSGGSAITHEGNGYLRLGANSVSNQLVLAANGKVGIGTLTPTATLHVSDSGTTDADGYSLAKSDADAQSLRTYHNGTNWVIAPKYGTQGGLSDLHLQASTGNTAGLLINRSTGNVGIGTTTPEATLTLAGPSGTHAIFRTNEATASQRAGGGFSSAGNATAASRYARMFLDPDGGDFSGVDYFTIEKFGGGHDNPGGEVKLINYSDSNMSFWVNTSVRAMTIEEGGQIGIGTAVPAAMLEVIARASGGHPPLFLRRGATNESASLKLLTTTTEDWIVGMRNDGTSNFRIYSYGASSDVFSILRSNGNVGIGTTTPASRLEVQKFFAAASGTANLRITSRHSGSYDGGQQLEFAYNDSGNVNVPNLLATINALSSVTSATNVGGILTFSTKALGGATTALPVARMTIRHDGNIGIGATVPTGKINVGYTNDVAPIVYAQGSEGLVINATRHDGSNYRGYVDFLAGRGSDATNGGASMRFFTQPRSSAAPTQALTLQYDGNVGIGTTDPGQKLHVNGNILVNAQILTPGGSNLQLNPNTGLVTVGGALTATGNITGGAFGPIVFTSSTQSIKWPNTSGQSASRSWGWMGEQGAYGYFQLYRSDASDGTLDTEVMRFRNTGNAEFRNEVTIDGNFNFNGNGTFGTGLNGAGNSGSIPAVSHYLRGYSVQYNTGGSGARLTNTGFLTWWTGAGWTSNERMWSFTNAYNMSGSGGPRFALLKGSNNTTIPTLGDNGALGTNTSEVCYWDKDGVFKQNGDINLTGDIGVENGRGVRGPSATEQLILNTTDGIKLTSGGTERVRIETDGNVGIGTTAPSAKLDIVESASYTPPLELNAPHAIIKMIGTPGVGYMGMGGGYLTNQPVGMFFRTDNLPMCWGAAQSSATHMTLLANGKFGIGITNPTARLYVVETANNAWALQVKGTGTSANYGLEVNCSVGAAASSQPFKVETPSGGPFFIDGYGNVGIGDGTPTYKLDVSGTFRTTGVANLNSNAIVGGDLDVAQYIRHTGDTNTQLRFESSQITIGTSGGSTISLNNDENIYFYSDSTEVVRFSDNNASDPQVQAANGKATRPSYSFFNDVDLGMYRDGADILRFSTAGVARLSVIANGNVGIGTDTPETPFHVYDNNSTQSMWKFQNYGTGMSQLSVYQGSGNLYLSLNRTDTYGSISMATQPFYIKHYHGSWVDTFSINTSGQVGINDSNASYMLDVNGTFRATDDGYFDQDLSVAANFSVSGSKNFVIDHPTKEGMKLVHSCIEGPEAAVYYRGRVQSDTITLPDYWSGLVRDGTITVQLTPNGSFQHLYVVSTSLSEIKIGAAEGETIDCYYTIYGERADLDPLVVEKIV